MSNEKLQKEVDLWAEAMFEIANREDWNILGDYFERTNFRTLISKDSLFMIIESWHSGNFSLVPASADLRTPVIRKYWESEGFENFRNQTLSIIVDAYKKLRANE